MKRELSALDACVFDSIIGKVLSRYAGNFDFREFLCFPVMSLKGRLLRFDSKEWELLASLIEAKAKKGNFGKEAMEAILGPGITRTHLPEIMAQPQWLIQLENLARFAHEEIAKNLREFEELANRISQDPFQEESASAVGRVIALCRSTQQAPAESPGYSPAEERMKKAFLGKTVIALMPSISKSGSLTGDYRQFRFETPVTVDFVNRNSGSNDFWRLFFSMKRAAQKEGNFGKNLLEIEVGQGMAADFLNSARDTRWLLELKKLLDGISKAIETSPELKRLSQHWEREMVDQGYF